jgi:hypothetical protein
MCDIVAVSASYLLPESYGSIDRGSCQWSLEGKEDHVAHNPGTISWSSLFDTSCSRFGRMDLLSKLSMMAVELLDVDFSGMTDDKRAQVGICTLSPHGSIATDIEFLREIGPSTFIYTLPSSAIGEICIRHQLKGPALCLTSKEETGRTIVEEATERIAMGEADSMLCLACDVRTPSANSILNSALDNQPNFCWYAYCLYLERKEKTRYQEKVVIKASDPSSLDIRKTCLELCRKNVGTHQKLPQKLGDIHAD